MKNKRGQFYIIAAVIIIVALAGITSIATYAIVAPTPRAIENLGLDLEKETSRIVEYGIYEQQDLDVILHDFSDSDFAPYFLQKTDNSNIVFIYGNKTDLEGVQYNAKSTGTISASIGSQMDWVVVSPFAERADINVDPLEQTVNVTVLERTFRFDLKENEMFYFLIIKERQGEVYVEKN